MIIVTIIFQIISISILKDLESLNKKTLLIE